MAVEKSSVSPTPGFEGQESRPAQKAAKKEQAFTDACVLAVKQSYVTKSKNRCWFGSGWGSGISGKLGKADEAGFAGKAVEQTKNLTAENIRFLTPDQIKKLAELNKTGAIKLDIDFQKAFFNARDSSHKKAIAAFLDDTKNLNTTTKASILRNAPRILKDALINLKTDEDRKAFSDALMQMEPRERVNLIKSLKSEHLKVKDASFTAPKSLFQMTPEILCDFYIAVAELRKGKEVDGLFFSDLTERIASPEHLRNTSEIIRAVIAEFTNLEKLDWLRDTISDESFVTDTMEVGEYIKIEEAPRDPRSANTAYNDGKDWVRFLLKEEVTPTPEDVAKLRLIFQMKEQLGAWTEKEKVTVKPKIEFILAS
jgi:hypothetical protein